MRRLGLIVSLLVFGIIVNAQIMVTASNHNFQNSLETKDITPTWTKTFGGIGEDKGYTIIESSDSSLTIVGTTENFGAVGDDIWLLHTDANGNHLWNRTYTNTDGDRAEDMVECSNGDFAIVGRTFVGDIFDPDYDVWLLRTDLNGNILWTKTIGGPDYEDHASIVECSNGDLAIAHKTLGDIRLIRTDQEGNHLWNMTYGTNRTESPRDIIECNDGGFAITGLTLPGFLGSNDFLLIRTNSVGEQLWNTTRIGFGEEVIELSDGSFCVSGSLWDSGDSATNLGIMKVSAQGSILWNYSYGGEHLETGASLVEYSEGGFIVAGRTMSYPIGDMDMWLVRTDDQGICIWNQTFGGSESDYGESIIETSDGGIVISGRTNSFGAGEYDLWLVRISRSSLVTTPPNIFPSIDDFDFLPIGIIGCVIIVGVIALLLYKKRN